jgi:hypothetical protein
MKAETEKRTSDLDASAAPGGKARPVAEINIRNNWDRWKTSLRKEACREIKGD